MLTEYITIDKELLAANLVYDTWTSVDLALSPSYKILYALFFDRYLYWRDQDNCGYDSITSLSEMSSISERTIKRFIKDMTSLGVIYKTRRDKGNTYVVHDIFESERWKIVTEIPQESSISKRNADDPDFDCPF